MFLKSTLISIKTKYNESFLKNKNLFFGRMGFAASRSYPIDDTKLPVTIAVSSKTMSS